jgi:hypothetical protein
MWMLGGWRKGKQTSMVKISGLPQLSLFKLLCVPNNKKRAVSIWTVKVNEPGESESRKTAVDVAMLARDVELDSTLIGHQSPQPA